MDFVKKCMASLLAFSLIVSLTMYAFVDSTVSATQEFDDGEMVETISVGADDQEALDIQSETGEWESITFQPDEEYIPSDEESVFYIEEEQNLDDDGLYMEKQTPEEVVFDIEDGVLVIPYLEDSEAITDVVLDETSIVRYNLGKREVRVAPSDYAGETEDYFDAEGNYSIWLGTDPFFPYEVQFSYNDTVVTRWFMTPQDQVEIDGHIFTVEADFTGEVVTQMSLNVGGQIVIVYPETKTFVDEGSVSWLMRSVLQPLTPTELRVDLSAFSPLELSYVSIDQIFTGDHALAPTDKLAWRYEGSIDAGDFFVSPIGGKVSLLYGSEYSSSRWEMVVCKSDQIDIDNKLYRITVDTPDDEWLIKNFAIRDEDNTLKSISLEEWNIRNTKYISDQYYGYGNVVVNQSTTCMDSKFTGSNGVIKLDLSSKSDHFSAIKVYSDFVYDFYYGDGGAQDGPVPIEFLPDLVEANSLFPDTDITSQIWGAGATGYNVINRYDETDSSIDITIVGWNKAGEVSGILPVRLSVFSNPNIVSGFLTNFQIRDKESKYSINYGNNTTSNDGVTEQTEILYKGYKADKIYNVCTSSDSTDWKVYLGHYSSLAKAKASGDGNDITDKITDSSIGYEVDFCQDIKMTIFDGETPYKYILKTKEGDRVIRQFSDGTAISFEGLKDDKGNIISPVYIVTKNYDSLGEMNYPIMFVGKDVDLSSVAPVFTTQYGVKLFASGSSTAEVSGVSTHDFSNGSVQYTASGGNKEVAKNYWLTILKAQSDAGKLVVTGEGDANSNVREENGVTYLDREVIMDSYHNHVHDIFVANMGMEPIKDLKVEFTSDDFTISRSIYVDDFWTLDGSNNLPGYQAVLDGGYASNSSDAELLQLPNIARVRLRSDFYYTGNFSGTLKFKSGENLLMEMNLTGISGDPFITTSSIPDAVKYVPYGTMIQNNNKYSWNIPKYTLEYGSLPKGMELKSNGELYGIPKEVGQFSFIVRMDNSSIFTNIEADEISYDTEAFTITVKDNTDENVDASTDASYDVTHRLQNLYANTDMTAKQTFRSLGEHNTLQYVYLDGVILNPSQYSVTNGSTIITVSNQTLANVNATPDGRHTFALEFRDNKGEVKRAAQNYYIKTAEGTPPATDNPPSTNNPSNNSGNNSGSNTNGGNNNQSTNNPTSSGGNNTNSNSNRDDNWPGLIQILWDAITGKNKEQANTTETEISYTIQSGDTLSKIAAKYLGSANNWRQIYEDNKATIKDPNKIYVGQVITIHVRQAGGLSEASDGMKSYTVEPNDSLWKIAKKVYGSGWRWKKIFDANTKTISNPHRIKAGQVLLIPE